MPLKLTFLYEQITPYYWLDCKYLNQSEGKNLYKKSTGSYILTSIKSIKGKQKSNFV